MRGTIAAVAEVTNFTPSAVSQQLALLEKETGVALLEKSGRRRRLTPEAELLVRATREVLDILEGAQAQLHAGPRPSGSVRVAVFQSAALALMPRTLKIMAAQFPEVRVEMYQREPEQAIQATWAREFDLVIAEQYPGHSAIWTQGLTKDELTTDAIRLAVPADSAASGLRELRDAAWVMEPPGTASRHFAEQLCRTTGFEPDVRYETADLQAQIRLIESGNAVGLIPDLVWDGREASCRLLDLATLPRRNIFTTMRAAGREAPAARAFRNVLQEVADGLGATPSDSRGVQSP